MSINQHKHSEERLNTNNGWGFGGWAGTQTTYKHGGVTIIERVGRRSYRHAPSTPYYYVYMEVEGVDHVSIIADKGDLHKAVGLLLIKSRHPYNTHGFTVIPVGTDGRLLWTPSSKEIEEYTHRACTREVYEQSAQVIEVMGTYTWDKLREMENAPGLDMVVR